MRDLWGGRAASSSAVAFLCAQRQSLLLLGHSFVWNFQHGRCLSFRPADGDRSLPFPRPLPRPLPRPPPGDGILGVLGAGE